MVPAHQCLQSNLRLPIHTSLIVYLFLAYTTTTHVLPVWCFFNLRGRPALLTYGLFFHQQQSAPGSKISNWGRAKTTPFRKFFSPAAGWWQTLWRMCTATVVRTTTTPTLERWEPCSTMRHSDHRVTPERLPRVDGHRCVFWRHACGGLQVVRKPR